MTVDDAKLIEQAPDIVGRLRLLAIMLDGMPPAAPQLLRDAADAVERLTAERDKQIRLGDALRAANANLRDDRDRLAAAIRRERHPHVTNEGASGSHMYGDEAFGCPLCTVLAAVAGEDE